MKLRLKLRLPALALGQTKVVNLIMIHSEQDQASELSRCSFLKIMKNLLFDLKAGRTGTHKAEVGAGAELRSWNGNFLKVGAGAGA